MFLVIEKIDATDNATDPYESKSILHRNAYDYVYGIINELPNAGNYSDDCGTGLVAFVLIKEPLIICANWIADFILASRFHDTVLLSSSISVRTFYFCWLYRSRNECIILVLCESLLYGISDISVVKFIKRLDYIPMCMCSFVSGWYYGKYYKSVKAFENSENHLNWLESCWYLGKSVPAENAIANRSDFDSLTISFDYPFYCKKCDEKLPRSSLWLLRTSEVNSFFENAKSWLVINWFDYPTLINTSIWLIF